MLIVNNGCYSWDLKYNIKDYNKNSIYKSNLNGTISIFRIIDNAEYYLHHEILLYLMAISRPISNGHFVGEDECRHCKQNKIIPTYDIDNIPYWKFCMDSYNGGDLLYLCDDCCNETDHYNKYDNIVACESFYTKAYVREKDVLFLFQHNIPMKYVTKSVKGCTYCKEVLYNSPCQCAQEINHIITTLFNIHCLLKELPIVTDLQHYIYQYVVLV